MEDYSLEINAGLYDTDLDEIGWEPELIDDSDKDAADMFGYNR